MKKDLYHVVFKGWTCYLQFSTYANNNRTAISLHDISDNSLVLVATVNLPEHDLPNGYVFIKDWSENEGVLRALYDAGIVSAVSIAIPVGYVRAHKCKLLIDID